MPKRSNDFQRLVYLVRLNLAQGAKVTESKMLLDRLTKKYREVDIVIDGKVGDVPVTVAIECRDRQRVADVTWVEEMKAKHERLETSALLLASKSGFTSQAQTLAEIYGISLFSLEDIESTDFATLLGADSSLWFKSVSIFPQRVSITVGPTGELTGETVATMPDNLLYLQDGTELCQVREVVEYLIMSPLARDYVLAQGQEEHAWFQIIYESPKDKSGNSFCMKKIEPEVLRPVESICVVGPCKIEIGRFGMRQGRLDGLNIAWGKYDLNGQDAMVAATVDSAGNTKLSVNFARSNAVTKL